MQFNIHDKRPVLNPRCPVVRRAVRLCRINDDRHVYAGETPDPVTAPGGDDPAMQRGIVNNNLALSHHFLQITQAQGIGQIPAHTGR
ncbi:hypothetical protein D3C87_1910140 [compost metagenome]